MDDLQCKRSHQEKEEQDMQQEQVVESQEGEDERAREEASYTTQQDSPQRRNFVLSSSPLEQEQVESQEWEDGRAGEEASYATQQDSPPRRQFVVSSSPLERNTGVARNDNSSMADTNANQQQVENSNHSASMSDDDDDGDDSDESSSDEEGGLSLLERRARNLERNKELLSRLGMSYGLLQKKEKRKKTAKAQDVEESSCTAEKGGMLLPLVDMNKPEAQCSSTANDLNTLYPFREAQLRKLTAWSEALQAQQNKDVATFVPAPIFVTGPSGSGKTAVVRASIEWVQQRAISTTISGEDDDPTRDRRLVDAYVDCAALDYPSIEEVTGSAYSQIERNIKGVDRVDVSTRKRKQTTRKRKRESKRKSHPTKSKRWREGILCMQHARCCMS
jgi:hypothetical protein